MHLGMGASYTLPLWDFAVNDPGRTRKDVNKEFKIASDMISWSFEAMSFAVRIITPLWNQEAGSAVVLQMCLW